MKFYQTHCNGDRPYGVFIEKNKVDVYTYEEKDDWYKPTRQHYTIPIISYQNVQKIWIGKDPYVPKVSKTFGDGNSILLYLGVNNKNQHRYVFIGDTLYQFQTPKGDQILKFWSPIGNNDVPYPVALGSQYAYFLLDRTYVTRTAFRPDIDWSDAYSDYYGHNSNPWYIQTYGKHWKAGKGFDREGYLKTKFTRSYKSKLIHSPHHY